MHLLFAVHEWPETICTWAHQIEHHGDTSRSMVSVREFVVLEKLSICIWHKHLENMRKDVRTKRTSYDGWQIAAHILLYPAPWAATKEKRTTYKDRANGVSEREWKKIISSAGGGKLKRCGHWNRQPTHAKTSGNTVSSNFNENIVEKTTP